jgi:ABC-type multidrug transport system ATPase subunit
MTSLPMTDMPGCGKSTFLKAISGQLNTSNCTLEGTIKFNGETADSNNFIVQKVVNFVNETDLHSALMTVYETFLFAFMATTGGHHAYAKSANEESAEILSQRDGIISDVRL